MAIVQFEHAFPVELSQQEENTATESLQGSDFEAKVAAYIQTYRFQARAVFIQRRNIWDECWKLYRGMDDFSAKQDWQSKIVLPKSFTSVKMATNTIKRLLSAARKPWDIEAVNSDDLVTALRAEQMTDITKLFLDKAYFLKEFSEGLECAFILGLGVWKLWWGMEPRRRTRVETRLVQFPPQMPPQGGPQGILGTDRLPGTPAFGQDIRAYGQQNQELYPPQMPGEALIPGGLGGGMGAAGLAPPNYVMVPQKEIVTEEIMEGRLFLRAVDPYNFYWLPGSKLNRWVGTIEDIEVSKWDLLRMAEQGMFSKEKVEGLMPRRIDERYKMSNLRFTETVMPVNGPNPDTAVVKLTEYYGPLVWDGKIIEERAHVILGNDSTVLLIQKNPFSHRKSPYIGFSPLNLPFRTEGVGIIEQVRFIDKALSQLANLSMDTLVFRLLPIFEVAMETLENPEDLETGIVPGKLLRKNLSHANIPAIKPIEFNDISSGAVQTWSALDRSHQEGSLISDVAEGLPRFRGAQTATETQAMQSQSESFMGGIAADIEKEAIEPMVEMAMDLIFQFLDTANDPRVASILGVGADVLRGMTREEVLEMISGDYKVKVSGITGQLMKSETLQNLVQFMNLIGQNPQAWLPYVNEDALLRRVLECFRPHIHDIEDIIADPATADAKKAAMIHQQILPQMIEAAQHAQGLGAEAAGAAQQGQQAAPPQGQITPEKVADIGLRLQEMTHERETQAADQRHAMAMQQQQLAGQMAIQQQQGPPQQGGQK